jgi:hypothetical protein
VAVLKASVAVLEASLARLETENGILRRRQVLIEDTADWLRAAQITDTPVCSVLRRRAREA